MLKLLKQRPLTGEKEMEIWSAIEKKRAFDDKEPMEVIKDSFGGDIEKYLRRMAEWHRVPIGHPILQILRTETKKIIRGITQILQGK